MTRQCDKCVGRISLLEIDVILDNDTLRLFYHPPATPLWIAFIRKFGGEDCSGCRHVAIAHVEVLESFLMHLGCKRLNV